MSEKRRTTNDAQLPAGACIGACAHNIIYLQNEKKKKSEEKRNERNKQSKLMIIVKSFFG